MSEKKVAFTGLAAALTVGPALLLAPAASAAAPSMDGRGGAQAANPTVASGKFQPYEKGRDTITYDQELVPVGSRAFVNSVATPDGRTHVWLAVHGLVPNRDYGSHAHVNACGASGDDAGPHFQNVPDPNPPSTDPEYANAENEVWLDFTTDAHGTGVAYASVDWQFGERRAASVVIHEEHTSTEPGSAGDAGARLGCMNVPW